MEHEIKTLTARLLAHRVVPRADALAKKALLDDIFRAELDKSLAAVGLRLVENPYAEHIAAALLPEMTEPVFGSGDAWLNNNLGLPRDGVALLVILWALIILPKRERQIARVEAGKESQSDMFGAQKPLETGETVSTGLSEDALYADFGKALGGRTRFNANLGRLVNLGFVVRRNRWLDEGPMLDLMIDYAQLAPRIIEGALADVLLRREGREALADKRAPEAIQQDIEDENGEDGIASAGPLFDLPPDDAADGEVR
ncbi:hypothetical protein [Chromobacterium phragmitis]|uniref:DUF4194 domain-containing protein n=1 Tax=Chromobacterium phragmitis TaxID=2202141 RepID=A0A344UHF7_9NEIS|nr:hypothetical protein [Chromobacterium phragmitis]AXE34705.1 hypothetical protein DK843_10605 [Chromobacterium phragmitis]